MCVRWFSESGQLAAALSVAMTMGRIGSVVVFNVLPGLAESRGLPASLWVVSMVVFASLVGTIVYSALNRRAQRISPIAEPAPEMFGISDLWSFNSSYWVVVFLVMMFYSGIFPFTAVATEQLHTHYHITASRASSMVSAVTITAMVLGPVFGVVADKLERQVPVLATAGCAFLVLAFSMLAMGTATPLLPVITIGIAFSIFPSAVWPSFSMIVPPHQVATAVGVVTAAQNLWLTIINLTTGVVADRYGFKVLMFYFTGLACASVLTGVAWMIVDVKNPQHRVAKIERSEVERRRLAGAGAGAGAVQGGHHDIDESRGLLHDDDQANDANFSY
jgi:nitrate/nitrite transporter NarK